MWGALFAVETTARAAIPALAPTPPMGWNSWDAYGLTISETDYRANTEVLATIRQFGWTYSVIDMGWYMTNPSGTTRLERDFQIDGNGLLMPTPVRFPSAASGAGFKPLADWVHGLGLKFGFHIMRGIPRGAVERNTPIANSRFHAADAADTSDACGWDDGNWGVRDNAAGQAYYDSMMQRYARWGVDFIKVDCIADHPYKISEIRQISRAIAKSGRAIILSLSPGPTHIEHAQEIGRYGQMWRISNDIWDEWHFAYDPQTDGYPSGIDTAFGNLAKWNRYARTGHWPDADMLAIGALRPSPGMGSPRDSLLTHAEEKTQFTLWAIGRSPLILGANLTLLDPFTRSLVTNRAVIAANQTTWESHPVQGLPGTLEHVRAWVGSSGRRNRPTHYVALFNLDDSSVDVSVEWHDLDVAAPRSAMDLWSGEKVPTASLDVRLPAHGSAIYQLR